MRIEVHKFGGTSVFGAERLRAVASLVMHASDRSAVVVVASAMSGVTNLLVEAIADARAGALANALDAISKVRSMHSVALDAIEGPVAPGQPGGPVRAEVSAILDDLTDVIRGAELVGEVTPRTRDRVVATGERLTVRLLALILRQQGRKAAALDADTFIDTDASYSDANPLPFVTDRGIDSALRPRLERGEIAVVTGFMGRAPDGSTTTFSRGGSDFTATLIGGALNANEVTIWTDVDGVFTADPRIVPVAALIPQLNYREAGEMSYYGAKVLHQRTMIPVASKRIPVIVRNTLNPGAPGSVVDGRSNPGAHPVKAVTAIKDQALVSLEGKGMSGVPGVSARLFGCLAARSINVTMISQSSSESSVCLAVPGEAAIDTESAIKREFRSDIARGDIEDVSVRQGVALVAAVGLGMAHTPGVAGNVFSALGEAGVNILAIAQGSSELNITLAVDQAEAADAIRAIHDRFALDTPAAAIRGRSTRDIVLLGCGKVGRSLLGLLQERMTRSEHAARLRVVGASDRHGFLFRRGGLSTAQLKDIGAAKAAGRSIGSIDDAIKVVEADATSSLARRALRENLTNPVLVDVSDSSVHAQLICEALQRGWDVVTANKRPLSGPWSEFAALAETSRRTGGTLRAEATVGAGLPIMDTLAMLAATGDEVHRIEGAFSGTLGFIMTAMDSGAAFSEAVAEAIDLGYTEPDPVTDLSGGDVARKAVILARFTGLAAADVPVRLAGLVSNALCGSGSAALMEEARRLDPVFRERIRVARAGGRVLRFAASVERSRIDVGPVEVPVESALGSLRGTDNILVIHSARYADRPLVITGPGAGAAVTAMGVLADILRSAPGCTL